jgi:hypothetical protein
MGTANLFTATLRNGIDDTVMRSLGVLWLTRFPVPPNACKFEIGGDLSVSLLRIVAPGEPQDHLLLHLSVRTGWAIQVTAGL